MPDDGAGRGVDGGPAVAAARSSLPVSQSTEQTGGVAWYQQSSSVRTRVLLITAGSLALAGDQLLVPAGAGLRDAGLGAEVHEDQAEPAAVPVGPLQVVEQRPDEVAAYVHPGLDGPQHLGEVI